MHTLLRALFWISIASVVAGSAALVYVAATSMAFTPNPADKQALECAQL